MDLKKISINELIAYEQGARAVCSKYENSIRSYDGTIKFDSVNGQMFEKYNKIYLKILDELERRLSEV